MLLPTAVISASVGIPPTLLSFRCSGRSVTSAIFTASATFAAPAVFAACAAAPTLVIASILNSAMMEPALLKELLENLYDRYNLPEFIPDDPISVPHRFTERADREIAGFFAATIAWGNRRSIVRNGHRMMLLMDNAPADFVRHASERELAQLTSFVHRTFNGHDLRDFVLGLRGFEARYGGLGAFFEQRYETHRDLRPVLAEFRREFFTAPHAPRCEKHLSSIERGAACKRLCMYLRWMVRRDDRGVDFGLWRRIPMSALYLPLDLHVGVTGRALGLLLRRQNDWRAVEEITSRLREFDAEDPVRYDFSLFGAGMDGYLKDHE